MDKKDNSATIGKALTAGAGVLAILVIISFFMDYFSMGAMGISIGMSGWSFFEASGAELMITYIILSLVFAIATAAIAVLKFLKLPLFGTKLFSFLFAVAAVGMLVVAILLMIEVGQGVGGSEELGVSAGFGIGLILNLILSVLAVGCTCGAFVLGNKK